MTQIIDNLLPREAPIGHYLGRFILQLARLGVPVPILTHGFEIDERLIREHLSRALTNGFLAIAPNEDWPAPVIKIQRNNDLPRRKSALRPKRKPRSR